ncbi:hypothetical protein NUW54_g11741 [Trametes sanguinea]|uniref:Uncharacterized protein n=1 Tax=Trametes sanguinea TaxID=158606 RepID=A0ACC1N8X3_9APHY|nr:hypothetical protein NUW54_g11741 [Trametes sanguinea]
MAPAARSHSVHRDHWADLAKRRTGPRFALPSLLIVEKAVPHSAASSSTMGLRRVLKRADRPQSGTAFDLAESISTPSCDSPRDVPCWLSSHRGHLPDWKCPEAWRRQRRGGTPMHQLEGREGILSLQTYSWQ